MQRLGFILAALGLFGSWAAAAAAEAGAQVRDPTVGVVTGTVVDEATGDVLTATTVRLLEVHRTELVRGDGHFGFTDLRPGTYTLMAERIGYHPETRVITVTAGATTSVQLQMHVAAVQIEEIMITGAISARAARDLLSSASVLSGAALDRDIGATVAASIENQPGVAVTSIGPAAARPVIRGLGGDRILLLEDGQRPGDLSSTSGDHAVAIEPITASRVEVVRGPLSLLYGSSALGGVVNVIRTEIPESVPEHIHGVVSSQGSSVNRGGSIAGQVLGGFGNFAVRGEASARTSGDIRTPLGSLVNTGAQTFGFSAGAAYVRPYGHAGASYRFYSNDYGIPGGFVGGHASGVDIEMRRHSLRGEVELHPEEASLFSNITATGAFTDYNHVEIEGSGSIGTRFAQRMVSGELLARHQPRGVFEQGVVGIRAQHRDIQTGGSLRTPSTGDVSLAAFLIEELGRGPLRFEAGARYDWARYSPREGATIVVGGEEVPVRERTFGSSAGSVGLLYVPREHVRLGASVTRAYRTPDFNELYSDGPHLAANSYDVGDPELRQETGLGLDLFLRLNGERVNAEVAAFRNRLNDYIFPSSRGRVERGPQRGRPRLQYTNQDADFSGLEGSVEWSLLPSWLVHGSASYVRAEFVEPRSPIPLFQDPDTVFIAASQYPPLIPPLHGSVGIRYETPQRFAGSTLRWAGRQERVGDFEDPTAAYAVVDLRAGVRLLWRERLHTVTIGIDNLFDHEYRDHLSRTKAIMPEPGRNLNLLYRLSF